MTTDKTPDDRPPAPRGSSPDEFSVFMPPRSPRSTASARRMLFAGVASACVLGVTLGIWARPAMTERRVSVAPPVEAAAKAPPTARGLAIVVDDRPAPLGAPIEVLSSRAAPPPLAPPRTEADTPAMILAPVRALDGLMRVKTLAPPIASTPTTPTLPAVRPHPAVEPTRIAAKPVHLAKVDPPPRLAPQPAPKPVAKSDLARAATLKAAAHKLELAEAARAAKADRLRLAQATRPSRLELAKAEARGRAEARAEAKAIALADARADARKRLRLASLVRAVRQVIPHAAKPHPAPAQTARNDRKPGHKAAHREPRVEQASLKARKAPTRTAPPPAYRAHAAPAPPPQRPSGLMRVSTPRCANRDPGEAAVCANPSLGAADRQLARAYQSARAAGVPDAQLRQQQQRWLSARSSAAREAPWAVHDVYLARIAELNGQAREAHGEND